MEQNAKKKISCGGFMLGEGLVLSEDGKTLNVSGGGGGVTTLHINVTGINEETTKAIFTADKTPAEIQQAALNGPVWCVVSFPPGFLAQEAMSIGVPPTWCNGNIAFGRAQAFAHNDDGTNAIFYAVRLVDKDTWILDLTAFDGA